MPELLINELLLYVFFMYKTERMQDISDVVDKYYSADAVADAKVALSQNYNVNGHDGCSTKMGRQKSDPWNEICEGQGTYRSSGWCEGNRSNVL